MNTAHAHGNGAAHGCAARLGRLSTLATLVALTTVAFSCDAAENAGHERQVLFVPSIISPEGVGKWRMAVAGRVFEPAEGSRRRRALIDSLAAGVGASPDNALYRSRAGYLVSDSNRNVRVEILLGDRRMLLPPSNAAGHVAGDILLSDEDLARSAHDGVVAFEAVTQGGITPRFRGMARVVPQQGVTVVTDMDDTIKVTEVRDTAQARANTFVRPFRAVAGMAQRYRAWQVAGAPHVHFHVVSAGPWQLHEPLRQFTEEAGFPDFTWDMRVVDVTDLRVLFRETVKADPRRLYEFKVSAIRALIARLPQRQFVLVGDSGEKDPEVYATIVSQFGARVSAVYIRDVTGEAQDAPRYRRVYATPEARAKLVVFTRPEELPRELPVAR